MKALLHCCCLCAAVLSARAADLALTLMVGPGPQVAGRTVQVDVVALNPQARDFPFKLGATLPGRLIAEGRSAAVTLSAVGPLPVLAPAGSFAVWRYEVTLPAGVTGDAILTVERESAASLRAALVLVPEQSAANGTGADEAPPLKRLAAASPASAALMRNFAGRFLPNQPVYFIYGEADHAAKFQFSFDYRLATTSPGEVPGSAIGTLRLGYTQRSVWDIDGDSSPFYDTSYMPEIAYSSDRVMPNEVSRRFTWLGWRVALQHESNGKERADSRSVNTVYLRPRFVLGTLGQWAFVMLPEFHAYVGESNENPDIKDYRGHGKLRFYFGHNDGPSLMFTGWTGRDFDHGTFQLDLAIPLRLRWLNLETYFYAQYFDGYGESLRDYRRRSDALRLGISLVR